MDQNDTVNKLKLNVEEFNMSLRKALELAFAAGFDRGWDEREKHITSNHIRRVQKYDINGKLLAEYGSIKEAAEDNGCKRNVIDMCLNGRRSVTAKGHIWKYAK